MLCEYLYDTTSFNRYGWFQCDIVDFKQFWHAYNHHHINRCYVKLANGTIWLWTRDTKDWQTTLIAPAK